MTKSLEIVSYLAPLTGIFHEPVLRSLQAGEESKWHKDYQANVKQVEESQKISPIYNAKGKIANPYSFGENLNFTA